MTRQAEWQRGMRDGMPICLGYIAVSFTFGLAAKTAGLSPLEALVMSVTNLTSAGQFAALGVIAVSGPYLELAAAQLIINLRYCLMSCALAQKLPARLPFGHRLLMACGVTDEIFGICAAREGALPPWYLYGALSVALPGWALGTLIGVVCGSVLPARVLSALGVALYGMFLAVILPPARRDKVLAGLVALSMLASLAAAHLPGLRALSSGSRIILLTLLLAGLAAFLFPRPDEPEAEAQGAAKAAGAADAACVAADADAQVGPAAGAASAASNARGPRGPEQEAHHAG